MRGQQNINHTHVLIPKLKVLQSNNKRVRIHHDVMNLVKKETFTPAYTYVVS